MKFLRISTLLYPLILTNCSNHSPLKEVTPTHQQVSLNLDAGIRPLLQQEMQAIQAGMMSLIPAMASGDWQKVSEVGKNIQNSYILKQHLSPQQRQHLHHHLPAAFIKKDHAFHKAAGMLAHAAEEGHIDMAQFYFYKLTTSCVDCHSDFAAPRFPNLAPKTHHPI